MDNANANETKTVELTPELEAKLKQIKLEEETKSSSGKGKKGLIAAVIILLLAVAAGCIAIALNNQKKKVDESGAIVEEEELTDTAMIAKLDDVIIAVNSADPAMSNSNPFTIRYGYTKNPELFKNGTLTDDEKLFTIIYYLRFSKDAFKPVEKSDYQSSVVQKYSDSVSLENFLEYGKRVSAETLAEYYRSIFGSEPNHHTLDTCGGAQYGADTGYYYIDYVGGCGGMDFRSAQIYRTDYKKLSDGTYAVDTLVMSQYNEFGDYCFIFKGYFDFENWDAEKATASDANVYKTCTQDKNGAIKYTLGLKDADSVSKYRYSFDSEGHFVKLEKVTE